MNKISKNKKPVLFVGIFMALIILSATIITLPNLMNDSSIKSPVDDVSDDVYYDLMEFYFYMTTFMKLTQDEDLGKAVAWMEAQEQYKAAEAYAEEHDVPHPMYVFPNPLFENYIPQKGTDVYSDTEETFINQMMDLMREVNKLDYAGFVELQKEIKHDLKIQDAYNMFTID